MADLLNIQQLPDFVRIDVERFVQKLIAINSSKTVAVYVYGSAASGNFIPGVSDVNLLVVVDGLDMDLLKANLMLVREGIRKRITAPLFLTTEHMMSSVDVFPIEFLDMKEHHVLLWGRDVLRNVSVDTSSLRLFCEQQVKGKLIRIRQAYLENGLRQDGKQKIFDDALKSLLPVFQNLLRLKGQSIPGSKVEVLRLVETLYSVSLPKVIGGYQARMSKSRSGSIDPDEGIRELILLLEKLAEMVDKSI